MGLGLTSKMINIIGKNLLFLESFVSFLVQRFGFIVCQYSKVTKKPVSHHVIIWFFFLFFLSNELYTTNGCYANGVKRPNIRI